MHVFGDLVAGDLASAEIDDIACLDVGILLAHDKGPHLLAIFFARHSSHLDVLDPVHAVQKLLDLPRIDIFASPDDHVLIPAGDGEVAGLVHDAKIAGTEPAVFGYSIAGGLFIIVVPLHDIIAATAHFALGTGRQSDAADGVDDLELHMGQGPADGLHPQPKIVADAGIGHDRRGLRQAIADGDVGHVHLVDDLLHDLDRAVGSCHDPRPQ